MSIKRGMWWTFVLVSLISIGALAALAENGCFTEPSYVARSNGCGFISEATAENNCRNQQGAIDQACMTAYFVRESSGITSCSDIAICAFRPGSWCGDACEQVNYQSQCTDRTAWTSQTAVPSQCVEGCCVCSSGGGICDPADPFKNQNQCTTFCQSIGGVAVFDTSMGVAQCTNTCGNLVASSAEVFGTIIDVSGAPLSGALVQAFGRSALTDASGSYQLQSLPAGDVTLVASHPLMETKQASTTLTSGGRTQIDFQLAPLGTGVVQGTVTDLSGAALSGAQVVARSAAGGVHQAATDASGSYRFSGLVFGEYSVTVSATGYQQQSAQAQLGSAVPLLTRNFQLASVQEGTITGQVVDRTTGAAVPFARIYVNGVFSRHSGLDGLFILPLPASSAGISYTVAVLHPNYQPGAAQTTLLTTGAQVPLPFSLVPLARECIYPVAKPVENFAASHVPTEKAVRLSWAKPCNEVVGYVINRTVAVPGIASSLPETIASIDVVPGQAHPASFVDRSVQWGAAYTYFISAIYADVMPRFSEKRDARITTGDQRCEGRHNGFEFTEFCDVSGRLRQSCTPENQVVAATSPGPADCSSFGSSFFCAPAGADTTCKDTGVCTSLFQNANPFGLWFSRFSCYGTPNAASGKYNNFCAFDRTATIFDACVSCNKVKSCFGYNGKDACQVNNCDVGDCTWVDSVPELGSGYCVDTEAKDKFGTEQCDLCGTSDSASLFSNAACTGAVCTALGACYAAPDSSSCIACSGQSACTDFGTETECTRGRGAQFAFGTLQPSGDSCSLGRCSWNSAAGQCFKEGNGDGQDDCASFVVDAQRCQRDNTPPTTTLSPDIIRVGELTDRVEFRAQDNNAPGTVHYCVDRTNDCLPNATSSAPYGGNGVVSVTLGDLGLADVYNSSPTYFIRFYSEDIFFNREDLKSRRIVADLDAPVIFLNYTAALDPAGSDIIFSIVPDEPATCSDMLLKRGTAQQSSRIISERNTSWIVVYENQPDGSYLYNVSCTDDFGNMAYRTVPVLDIDALNFISVTSPQPAMSESTFPFTVRSSDPSDCELYDGQTRVEALSTSDHLLHSSTPKTFPANIFHTQWKALCTELSSGERHEKFVPFTIDKQPPRTSIELVSDDGISRVHDTTNWTTFMDSVSLATLLCDDFPKEAGQSVGFGCGETLHCVAPPNMTRCTPTIPSGTVDIDDSSTVCFHSADNGGNQELTKCGTVVITPSFGIELVSPRYGISPLPRFDLQVSSRVPSSSCKWTGAPPSGVAVAFNFTNLVTATNIFDSVNPYLFEIKNFSTLLHFRDGEPLPIIVRCVSSAGVVSPPQVLAVGYDTTVPRITVARAEPPLITQGNSVDLIVETDEPTLCRYGQKATPSELTSRFPGFDAARFSAEHRVTHHLTTNDDGRSHLFNVSCVNRAGNVSVVAPITFTVDFSVAGTITSTEPRGALSDPGVTLAARTSKDAFCDIAESNGTSLFYQQFTSTGGMLHMQQRANLSEGSYAFRVRCSFFAPSATREALINFTIDRTPPTIASVDDGNSSCSLTPPVPSVAASDAHSSVASYEYQLIEKPTTIVVQGTLNSSNGTFSNVSLELGKDYFFKLKPVDAAGNIGSEKASDGFTVIPANSSICRNDLPPVISIMQNLTKAGARVTVQCIDDNGCSSVTYGTSEKQESCQAKQAYIVPVVVGEEAFFCVLATDTAGNTATRSEKITVPDKDGDGITDSFDTCDDTPAAATADDKGCSSVQLLVDADNDGLDDSWELRYDEGASCPLDPRNPDSDSDGVNDGDEDYDGDGMNNKEEYRTGNDPCTTSAFSDVEQPSAENMLRQTRDEEASLPGGLLIVFGLFMAFGGVAYLGYVHYYTKAFPHTLPVRRPVPIQRPARPVQHIPPEIQSLARKRQEARRESERKQRSLLFSAFGGTAEEKSEKTEKPEKQEKTETPVKQQSEQKTGMPDTLRRLKELAQRGKKR